MEEPKHKKWWYKVTRVELKGEQTDQELDKYGKEGWELVSFYPTAMNDLHCICVFKRPYLPSEY